MNFGKGNTPKEGDNVEGDILPAIISNFLHIYSHWESGHHVERGILLTIIMGIFYVHIFIRKQRIWHWFHL